MRRAMLLLLVLALLLSGCTEAEPVPPAEDPTPPPIEEPTPSLVVQTDWSQLGEREELPPPVGTRRYENYSAGLIPADDYGRLIPYAGLRLMDDWPADDGCLYGLMTTEGEVVVDPVYSSVDTPRGYAPDGTSYVHPLLILRQGQSVPHEQEFGSTSICAVAAADGSWCTPFDYVEYRASKEGLILFTEDSIHVMVPDGTITQKWPIAQMGLTAEEYRSILSNLFWHEGISGWRTGDYLALDWDPASDYEALFYFDLVRGTRSTMTLEEWNALEASVAFEQPQYYKNGSPIHDKLLGYDAPHLVLVSGYANERSFAHYYCADGTALLQFSSENNRWYQRLSLVGGLIEVLDWNCATYYDLDTLDCVFRTYFGYEGD